MNQLRENLSPFLQAIKKALFAELEIGYMNDKTRRSIIDEIIQNVPAENYASMTRFPVGRTSDTLQAELRSLLNLR